MFKPDLKYDIVIICNFCSWEKEDWINSDLYAKRASSTAMMFFTFKNLKYVPGNFYSICCFPQWISCD